MEDSANEKHYEDAAFYRDQIRSLKKVQQQQYVVRKEGDVDAIALVFDSQNFCIGIISIRSGLVLGNKTFLKEVTDLASASEILSTFLSQYYLNIAATNLPKKIIVNYKLDDRDWLANAIAQNSEVKIKIIDSPKTTNAKWLLMAKENAESVLNRTVAAKAFFCKQLQAFKDAFRLLELPKNIACFDVSHTGGEATVVSCVVFSERGAEKNNYRRYNIKNGFADDYAALREALTRHFTKAKEQKEKMPDVLLIDGGKGQLNIAKQILEELQIVDIYLLAIAKGPSRKPGLEEIYSAEKDHPISLNPDSPALHVLQQIRDEAHRFAITGQRRKLAKGRKISILENIPGIGKAKSNELLKQFGGLQGLKEASLEQLMLVKGINLKTARKIYEYLRNLPK
jgi:excinuclease ABC subunit C